MTTHVRSNQRFTHGRRCPICGGADNDPRGKEKRCHGYISSDGLYAHCTREELAGAIARHDKSEAFPHRLTGPCACGVTHMQADRNSSIEAEYNYLDESGKLLYQAVRLFPKSFRQRRPDGLGGWIWNLQDTRRVLYRLPELLAADRALPVYIVEGEKDVETLRSRGYVATCNPMGAKKFHFVQDCARDALRERHVVIVPDADNDGRAHADQVENIVSPFVASLRRFEVPGVKDVSDWFAAGGTNEQFDALRMAAPPRTRGDAAEADHVFADRDEEPAAPPQKKRIGKTWDQCVDEIYARKDEPWIAIRIANTVIATCRNGSFVPLVAPSGAGKSSLSLQMLVDHAMHEGPAVYMTYELDGDEAVARAIGQHCSSGWASVLRGELPRDRVPTSASLPQVSRIRILERDEARLEVLAKVIEELRAEFPNQSILVVSDYIQATPAPPGKERGYTANVSSDLRRAAKSNRVVIIGVSQASTDNSKKMRAGDLLGIDAAATGAETAQIERDAYVILTLGDRKEVDPDTVSWKLSVAKYRLGEADLVYELHYRGRIGVWEITGDPRKAAEIRAEKDEERKKARSSGGVNAPDVMFKRLVKEWRSGKRELCTKRYLRNGNGFGKEVAELALETLVEEGRARIVVIERDEGGAAGKKKEREIYEPILTEGASE